RRRHALELSNGRLRSVLQPSDLSLGVGKVDLLMLVLAFDLTHELAEHVLHGVPQDLQQDVLLRGLAEYLAVGLLEQLRICRARDVHTSYELRLIQGVARSAQRAPIQLQPVVLIFAIRKNTELVAKEENSGPFFL